jgi:hypothetical protein
MKLLLCVLIALPLTSLGQNTHVHKADKPANSVIVYSCAIVVFPSDIKISYLKKTNSADDYNTIVDDNENYQAESTSFLDSVKLKQIFKQSSGYMVFETANGQVFQINLNTYTWGVILFNGKSKPHDADMTDMQNAYKNYMK